MFNKIKMMLVSWWTKPWFSSLRPVTTRDCVERVVSLHSRNVHALGGMRDTNVYQWVHVSGLEFTGTPRELRAKMWAEGHLAEGESTTGITEIFRGKCFHARGWSLAVPAFSFRLLGGK